MSEQALTLDCQGSTMIGILHRPATPARRGVVVVVGGGPQYRVGGHRQLTLWARTLCTEGFPVLRFDYRGMGDAHGEFQGFMAVDDDIRCAVDRLVQECPQLDEVVLWGECDAASAILLYAGRDSRVKGAVLLNPWVRTEALQAKAVLKHYYLQRLMEPSLWKKVFSGQFNPFASARSAFGLWLQSRRGPVVATSPTAARAPGPIARDLPLPQSLLIGAQRFKGRVLLVMSGRDLIAREFDDVLRHSPEWQQALTDRQTRRHDLPEGDHTFSSARLRGQVVAWSLDWLRSW